MPGPKMGPRPHDFDEHVIRMSPTFLKWMQLQPGQKLRYACREFVKDKGDDEERLMRRIMIARRNNIRDHETLKKARKINSKTGKIIEDDDDDPATVTGEQVRAAVPTPTPPTMLQPGEPTVTITAASTEQNVVSAESLPVPVAPDVTSVTTTTTPAVGSDDSNNAMTAMTTTNASTAGVVATPASSVSTTASTSRRRRSVPVVSDQQVEQEMDVPAVEATRSYRAWAELPEGQEFVYNQKYIKGREGHDWLLRKNIWRRMRYRRENKKMVERMKKVPRLTGADSVHDQASGDDYSGTEQAPPLAFSPEDYRKEQLEQSERNAKKSTGGIIGVNVEMDADGNRGDPTAPSPATSVKVTVGAAIKMEPSVTMKLEPGDAAAAMVQSSHDVDPDETNSHLVAAAAAAASSSSGDDHHLAADPDAVAAAVAVAATFGTHESAVNGNAVVEADTTSDSLTVAALSSSSSSSSSSAGVLHHPLLASPDPDEAHAAALDAAAKLAAATTTVNSADDDVNVALDVAADVAMAVGDDTTDLYNRMNEAAAAAAAVVASASELEEV